MPLCEKSLFSSVLDCNSQYVSFKKLYWRHKKQLTGVQYLIPIMTDMILSVLRSDRQGNYLSCTWKCFVCGFKATSVITKYRISNQLAQSPYGLVDGYFDFTDHKVTFGIKFPKGMWRSITYVSVVMILCDEFKLRGFCCRFHSFKYVPYRGKFHLYAETKIFVLGNFSSLAVPELAGMTILGAASEKIANMTAFWHQCSCTTRVAFTNMVNIT